jgi:hypothetical protein
MGAYTRNHFVPAFLLRQWHGGLDDRLVAFGRKHGRIVADRRKAESVAYDEHLYSIQTADGALDTSVEQHYMTPRVDTPAAAVHKRLLANELAALSEEEQATWARFLVSLWVRHPGSIEHMRQRGRALLLGAGDAGAGSEASDDDEVTGRSDSDLFLKFAPHELDNLGNRTLPQLIESDLLRNAATGKHWMVFAEQAPRFDLVIGDVPLICGGTPASGRFLAALPLSPKRLFISFSSDQLVSELVCKTRSEIFSLANQSSVMSAQRSVYASNTLSEPLVRKYLRPVGSGEQRKGPRCP